MDNHGVRDLDDMSFGRKGLPAKRHYNPVFNAGGCREVAAEEAVPLKRTKHLSLQTRVRATKISAKSSLAKRIKCKTSSKLETLKPHCTVKSTKLSIKTGPTRRPKQNTPTKTETLFMKRRVKPTKVSMKCRPTKGTKRKAANKSETLLKKQRFETTKVSVKIVPASQSSKARPRPQTLLKKHQGKTKSQTLMRKHRYKTKPVNNMRSHRDKTKLGILIRKTQGKAKMETLSRNRGGNVQLDWQMHNRGAKRKLEMLTRRQRGKTESMKTILKSRARTILASRGSKRKTSTIPESLTRSQWLKATQMSMVHQAEKQLLPSTVHDSLEHKYQQLEKIGEGGFGSVYAGYRKTDSFPVAIKHIPKDEVKIIPLDIKGRKHDIPLEALLMLQASCIKNADGKSAVVSLLDKYDLDQELVLVMEKPVRSVDLFTCIARCRHFKENEAKNIMRQLVDAAIKMHAVNVFHRDLKPGNILLEATYGVPRVRVIDFGCSCFVTEEPYHIYTGTLSYAPPEFVLRGTYRAGPTTVWHLGAMLFELLAGSKQFDTVLFISQMLQLNRVLSQDCKDFLQMCLKCDPEQRATLVQIHQHPWLI
nr:aurora kinase B-like [Nerophis lumbriciformis]